MDTVMLEARGVLEGIAPHLLEEMEAVQRAQFEPACPVVNNSQGPDSCYHLLTRRPTASQGQQTSGCVCTTLPHLFCWNCILWSQLFLPRQYLDMLVNLSGLLVMANSQPDF